MIDREKRWYVDFDYPQFDAKEVSVIVDSKTLQVELYQEEEDMEWFEVTDKDHFYQTIEEAHNALTAHRKELYNLMPKVKKLVMQMNNMREILSEIPNDENDIRMWRNNHPEYFNASDFLPSDFAENDDEGFYGKANRRLRKEKELLVNVIRSGFLNINAETFRVSDVETVRWGEHCAEIVLKNNHTIKTISDYDYNVICIVFGENTSQYTYTQL